MRTLFVYMLPLHILFAHRFIKFLTICLICITIIGTAAPVKSEILEAQWEVKQVRFRFVGMSTAYTCDSMENILKRLLRLLGARDDARAESRCIGNNGLSRVHRVKLAFAIPRLADKTDISREIVPAEWQEVKITGRSSRHLDSGDCELMEQFERQVLPHFQVSKLNKRIRCVPSRSEFNNVRLKLNVLKVLEKTELEDASMTETKNSSQDNNR
jgi:hypothetical protein